MLTLFYTSESHMCLEQTWQYRTAVGTPAYEAFLSALICFIVLLRSLCLKI